MGGGGEKVPLKGLVTSYKVGNLRSCTSSRVGDNTPILLCNTRWPDTRELQSRSVTKDLPIFIWLRFPLPLVTQRFRSGSFNSKETMFAHARESCLQAWWLGSNFWRLSCMSEWNKPINNTINFNTTGWLFFSKSLSFVWLHIIWVALAWRVIYPLSSKVTSLQWIPRILADQLWVVRSAGYLLQEAFIFGCLFLPAKMCK